MSARGLVGSLSAVAPPSGGREDFSQIGPTEMGFQKIKEGLWVGRQITWTLKRSEPRRAPPAKESQEAVSKAMLAMCPLILNLTSLDSPSARSWGKRTNLGLLAQTR